MCECTRISHKKCDERANIHIENVKIMNDINFDTNINHDMCMKVNVMLIFIDIKLCIVYKYIYLYHTYCYLPHLYA